MESILFGLMFVGLLAAFCYLLVDMLLSNIKRSYSQLEKQVGGTKDADAGNK